MTKDLEATAQRLEAQNAQLRAENADLQDAVLGLEALVDHLRSGEPTRSLEEVMAELQRQPPAA